MMNDDSSASWHYQAEQHCVTCRGTWTTAHCDNISQDTLPNVNQQTAKVTLDGSQIAQLDTTGTWLIQKFINKMQAQNTSVELQGFDEKQLGLLQLIDRHADALNAHTRAPKLNPIAHLGKVVVSQVKDGLSFLSFVGEVAYVCFRKFNRSRGLFLRLTLNTIDQTGFRALMIVGLLSLLIGIVLAYQMGAQLQSYGASIYIVDLLGISILREFGPLITAIIVAGRTASSFTAEIGAMKINEEIDAMRTIGLTPGEVLVLPKILGLVIALPLLSLWADGFGILGGMLMSKSMLGITYTDFLMRFKQNVALRHLLIGLAKTPVFALLISSVGCFHGFRVSGSSDSVGLNTTKSVVLAIFLIIVADAAFSVLFSWKQL